MGTVWRAADTLLRRDVAIKEVILPPGLAPTDRDAMYERTMREARAAAALQHPAVVQVYDVVHENGRPWIVMELLEARSLADMVIEDGPVNPRVVAKIGIALLGALEVAHAHGVLHRDVKPANVLICTDGRCVLTDFGVARMPTDVQLTTPGMVLGSPHFISPERAMGSDFGPPSDLLRHQPCKEQNSCLGDGAKSPPIGAVGRESGLGRERGRESQRNESEQQK